MKGRKATKIVKPQMERMEGSLNMDELNEEDEVSPT